MKLDRNISDNDGGGKYAVINLRKLDEGSAMGGTFDDRWTPQVMQALRTLEEAGALEWGITGKPDEFFVIKLKDRHARAALLAYERSIEPTDPEFALEVADLASRAGMLSAFCKEPD